MAKQLSENPERDYRIKIEDLIRWRLNGPGGVTLVDELTPPGGSLIGLFARWICVASLENSNADPNTEKVFKEAILEKFPDPGIFLAITSSAFHSLIAGLKYELQCLREVLADENLDDFEKKFLVAYGGNYRHKSVMIISVILEARLEVGYFILGLKELWPNEAPRLEQQLWDDLGLAVFDEELLNLDNEAKDLLAPEVRVVTMDEPIALTDRRAEFNALLALGRHGTPCADD